MEFNSYLIFEFSGKEELLAEILNDNTISGGLKNFIKANYLKCLDYAREFFADDLLQAAEYLYDMI